MIITCPHCNSQNVSWFEDVLWDCGTCKTTWAADDYDNPPEGTDLVDLMEYRPTAPPQEVFDAARERYDAIVDDQVVQR